MEHSETYEHINEIVVPAAADMLREHGKDKAIELLLSAVIEMLRSADVYTRMLLVSTILTTFNQDGTEIF